MSETEKKHREIDALGEFGLIETLTKDASLKNASSLKGVGDDAAEIEISAKESMLLSTDMLIEGVHFNLSYVPLKSLGFKAVSVNVSDILAMNAKPEQITVSLGISSKFPVEALEELYKGIHAACEFYNVDLVGGDTTSSSSASSSSSSNEIKLNCERITHSSTGFKDADARDSWFPQSIQISYANGSKAAKINEKGYEHVNYDLQDKGGRLIFITSAQELQGGLYSGSGRDITKRFTLLKNKTLLAQFPDDARVNLRYSCE